MTERFENGKGLPESADTARQLRIALQVQKGIVRAYLRDELGGRKFGAERDLLLRHVDEQHRDILELISLAESEYPRYGIDPRTEGMIRGEIRMLLDGAIGRMAHRQAEEPRYGQAA